MTKIVVVNKLKDFQAEIPGVEIITAKTYLSDPRFIELTSAKIYNICRSYRYQGDGYYISLLAKARGHKVIPDITTIQDSKTQSIIRIKSEDMDQLIEKSLADVDAQKFTLNIYFGKSVDPSFQTLSQQLYNQFPSPLLCAYFTKRNGRWFIQDVDPISTKGLPEEEQAHVINYATEFFARKDVNEKKPSQFRYEMAILVNPDEQDPPSNKTAIKKFIRAAEDLGIGAWTITKDEYNEIGKYDALFIRETTNVNHYTYRFARRAAVEGLVVMDDPESILRCSNKVYLAELLERNNIPTPKTMVIHKDNLGQLTQNFHFPIILKLPDSCFSIGVIKVKDMQELEAESSKMLEKSDLIIAQEFMPTEYDWRIGIIDNKPLFACKYYMANKHWQIINSNKNGSTRYGKAETFAIEDVPPSVIKTAVKAANLLGNGLYGVDIKEIKNKNYVIEINDNPNIDAGVEDGVIKNSLYSRIMQVYLDRMQHLTNGIHK
jgi:glutathione synthase/RimK-type ligase-like ATP-grasp enzyme